MGSLIMGRSMAKKEQKKTEKVEDKDFEMLEWVFHNSRDRKVRNKVGAYLGHDMEAEANSNSFEEQGIDLPDNFRVKPISKAGNEEDKATAESGMGGDVVTSDSVPEASGAEASVEVPSE